MKLFWANELFFEDIIMGSLLCKIEWGYMGFKFRYLYTCIKFAKTRNLVNFNLITIHVHVIIFCYLAYVSKCAYLYICCVCTLLIYITDTQVYVKYMVWCFASAYIKHSSHTIWIYGDTFYLSILLFITQHIT